MWRDPIDFRFAAVSSYIRTLGKGIFYSKYFSLDMEGPF